MSRRGARIDARDSPVLDTESLGSAIALELLEDLEFYAWLDGRDSTG